MKKKKGFLYYVYCALGEKSHPHCNKTADRVALIRLLITLQILITNGFIVANAIRHWNDKTTIQVVIDSSTLPEYQTPEAIKTNKSFEFE
jgi:hypothetical protein